MVSYTNFYETLKEADMRVKFTLVLYDDEPYYVIGLGNHNSDGIFRIYLDKAGNPDGFAHQRLLGIPCLYEEANSVAAELDKWLKDNPGKGIIRKKMNSPAFNKFRPFPLGMVNNGGSVIYTERRPVRHTQQGLTDQMIRQQFVSLDPKPNILAKTPGIGIFSRSLADTIVNKYPDPYECLQQMLSPDNDNSGVAFHRQFALMKGPVNTVFLAYKEDVVGVLPEGDFQRVRLSPDFKHTKEVVERLRLFNSVEVM